MSEGDFGWLSGWLNYYSHQTNLLRHFLGEDYELDYFHTDDRGTSGVVKSASGVRSFLEFPSYRVNQWDEGIQVFFRNAIVRVDIPAPLARQRATNVTIYENAGTPQTIVPDVPQRWSMAEQAQAFVASILDGAEPLSPPREAAKEVEFANSIVRWRQAQGA